MWACMCCMCDGVYVSACDKYSDQMCVYVCEHTCACVCV